MKTTETVNPIETVNPWQEKRKVFIPKYSRGEQETRLVSVNGRDYFVPKGREVDVPLPVYEVLMNSEDMRKALQDSAKEEFRGAEGMNAR